MATTETKTTGVDLSQLVDIGNDQWLKASLVESVKVRKGNEKHPYIISIEHKIGRPTIGVVCQSEDEALDHAAELIERINGALQTA